MPIQLVCSSKGKAREADAVVDLIAAHRRAISELECLGKRLMHAEEAEAQLIGPRLFGERNGYSTAGSDGAGGRCWRAEMKAAYFARLIFLRTKLARGWRPLRIRGYSLSRSAGNVISSP
ncbi:hypothetical protein EOA24_40035 [Mesorhizobium sp. M2A.F.Ca.ET.039.01.1.1]|nr:hypothetical protein EOA24_40035 [Mesorhizobium sp. M2A.F.Ca.ET.039.01.1.1]